MADLYFLHNRTKFDFCGQASYEKEISWEFSSPGVDDLSLTGPGRELVGGIRKLARTSLTFGGKKMEIRGAVPDSRGTKG